MWNKKGMDQRIEEHWKKYTKKKKEWRKKGQRFLKEMGLGLEEGKFTFSVRSRFSKFS